MDLLTTLVFAAALAVIGGRVVEIANRRPDAFAGMFEGAYPFATAALRESADMRRIGAPTVQVVTEATAEDEQDTEERPAMAA